MWLTAFQPLTSSRRDCLQNLKQTTERMFRPGTTSTVYKDASLNLLTKTTGSWHLNSDAVLKTWTPSDFSLLKQGFLQTLKHALHVERRGRAETMIYTCELSPNWTHWRIRAYGEGLQACCFITSTCTSNLVQAGCLRRNIWGYYDQSLLQRWNWCGHQQMA